MTRGSVYRVLGVWLCAMLLLGSTFLVMQNVQISNLGVGQEVDVDVAGGTLQVLVLDHSVAVIVNTPSMPCTPHHASFLGMGHGQWPWC